MIDANLLIGLAMGFWMGVSVVCGLMGFGSWKQRERAGMDAYGQPRP